MNTRGDDGEIFWGGGLLFAVVCSILFVPLGVPEWSGCLIGPVWVAAYSWWACRNS